MSVELVQSTPQEALQELARDDIGAGSCIPPKKPEYKLLKEIGSGAFGSVYTALSPSDQVVAVKLTWSTDGQAKKTFKESSLTKAVAERLGEYGLVPDFVKQFAFYLKAEEDVVKRKGQKPICCALVMECIDGVSLWDLHWSAVDSGKPLTLDHIGVIYRDIAIALNYLHTGTPPLLHRDIKPENIMADADGRVVLCDFGLGRKLSPEELAAQTYCGTAVAMAPELHAGGKLWYSSPVDIWALATTMVAVATGKELDYCLLPAHQRTSFWQSNWEVPMPDDMPPALAEVTKACLQYKPEWRPTAEALLEYPLLAARPNSDELRREIGDVVVRAPEYNDVYAAVGKSRRVPPAQTEAPEGAEGEAAEGAQEQQKDAVEACDDKLAPSSGDHAEGESCAAATGGADQAEDTQVPSGADQAEDAPTTSPAGDKQPAENQGAPQGAASALQLACPEPSSEAPRVGAPLRFKLWQAAARLAVSHTVPEGGEAPAGLAGEDAESLVPAGGEPAPLAAAAIRVTAIQDRESAPATPADAGASAAQDEGTSEEEDSEGGDAFDADGPSLPTLLTPPEKPVEIVEKPAPTVAIFYRFEQLRKGAEYPKDVDPAHREQWLSDEDFKRVLGMTKQEFEGEKKWRQQQKKRDCGLF